MHDITYPFNPASRLETISPQDAPRNQVTRELVLAWAKDAETGAPVYVRELSRDQTGLRCGCICPACGAVLEAVNAGKKAGEYQQTPHFRHPDGQPRDACSILTARFAALEAFRRDGTLTLPRIRRAGSFIGISGKPYEAWINLPSRQVTIKTVSMVDVAEALLMLDDGRQIRVQLVGIPSTDAGDVDADIPTIQIVVDDPELAALDPDTLRSKLMLLGSNGHWCSHWPDATVTDAANKAARDLAESALDWIDPANLPADTPQELRYETLLHVLAKQILEREKRIHLPELAISISQVTSDGIERSASHSVPREMVVLQSVKLESPIERIRPDVMAEISGPIFWEGPLLIEITVTNPIDDERLSRIRAVNLQTLEIDLRQFGGKLDLAGYTDLVLNRLDGKRWIHHPYIAIEQRVLSNQLAQKCSDIDAQLTKERLDRETKQAREAEQLNQFKRMLELTPEDLAEALLTARIEEWGIDPSEIVQKRPDNLELRISVKKAVHGLVRRGYDNDALNFLTQANPGMLDRLLSIKLDRPIGYRLNSTWQVINTIASDRPDKRCFLVFYLAAIKVYQPTISEEQQQTINQWRKTTFEGLRSLSPVDQMDFRPPYQYVRIVKLLFPELLEVLTKALVDTNNPPPKTDGHAPRDSLKQLTKSNTYKSWR